MDICKKVIADKSLAESLLPTSSGFFFGGTEYDEWYFNAVEYTIEVLETELLDEYADDFEYSASW